MHKIPLMAFPWIIYIRDQALAVCDSDSEADQLASKHPEWIRHEAPLPQELPRRIRELQQGSAAAQIWKVSDLDSFREHLMALYTHWQAGGGLITNPQGEVLMMFRRGFWDLPKGKLDPGETPEACALREVAEETGLQRVRILSRLQDTWHAYPQKEDWILKQTHWYRMASDGTERTVAQIEEDILDIQWVSPRHLEKYLKFTYPNIRSVFRDAGMTD